MKQTAKRLYALVAGLTLGIGFNVQAQLKDVPVLLEADVTTQTLQSLVSTRGHGIVGLQFTTSKVGTGYRARALVELTDFEGKPLKSDALAAVHFVIYDPIAFGTNAGRVRGHFAQTYSRDKAVKVAEVSDDFGRTRERYCVEAYFPQIYTAAGTYVLAVIPEFRFPERGDIMRVVGSGSSPVRWWVPGTFGVRSSGNGTVRTRDINNGYIYPAIDYEIEELSNAFPPPQLGIQVFTDSKIKLCWSRKNPGWRVDETPDLTVHFPVWTSIPDSEKTLDLDEPQFFTYVTNMQGTKKFFRTRYVGFTPVIQQVVNWDSAFSW